MFSLRRPWAGLFAAREKVFDVLILYFFYGLTGFVAAKWLSLGAFGACLQAGGRLACHNLLMSAPSDLEATTLVMMSLDRLRTKLSFRQSSSFSMIFICPCTCTGISRLKRRKVLRIFVLSARSSHDHAHHRRIKPTCCTTAVYDSQLVRLWRLLPLRLPTSGGGGPRGGGVTSPHPCI